MKRLVLALCLLAVVVSGALYLLWPRRGQSLVLYSAVDYGPDVARAFKKRTGIDVKLVDISTGALLAKVSAEGHRPAWSLLWFDGDLAAAALDKAGLLGHHSVPDLPFTSLGKSLVPADGSYTPTGLTLAGAFTYHPAELKRPPARWTDLLAPGLKGEVGMNNPSISGPTYPILAGMLSQAGGWPQGETYVLGLAHDGLHIYAKNANTLAALKAGDIKVAVTQSSAAWNAAAKDSSLRVVIPDPSFALPSVIALSPKLSSRKHDEAERFIRFAMSPEGQALRLANGEGDGYYWPLTTNVKESHGMPALASLHVTRLGPAKWGALEGSINAWFDKSVVNQ